MSEENIAVVRRLFDEVWGNRNPDAMDEVMSDDYVDHDPIMGEGNRESAKQAAAGYLEAFPDLKLEIVDIIASGDKVAYRWIAQGTFENPLMGFEPNHERGEPIEGIAIDRLENGKIVEGHTQWNTLQFMRDIGAMPAEAEAAAG